jgi:uncharacterized protein DUF4168
LLRAIFEAAIGMEPASQVMRRKVSGRNQGISHMLRTSLCAATAAIALGACTSTGAASHANASAAPAQAAPQSATSAPPTTEAAAPPTSFTDEQLRAFSAAAREIQPMNAQLTSGTAEQRATAAEHVRQILARNNLDGATYNAIAAQAQSDPALAQRIAALASGGANSPG